LVLASDAKVEQQIIPSPGTATNEGVLLIIKAEGSFLMSDVVHVKTRVPTDHGAKRGWQRTISSVLLGDEHRQPFKLTPTSGAAKCGELLAAPKAAK